MKEDVDELARLFGEGKKASNSFEELYSSIVPNRMHASQPEMGRGEYGIPIFYYPEPEPEHPKTAQVLEQAKQYIVGWVADIELLLDKVGKARYKMQFADPDVRVGLRGIGKTTANEDALAELLDDFEQKLGELRKIIIDLESNSERALPSSRDIEPASYDAKTRTIFFADEAIRFKKNAEYSPAFCRLMFEAPGKLWQLKDFQKLWDSQYELLNDLQKPTDWNKVYDAIKKINSRVEKYTDIPDLFKLTTKSVRLNPRYVTPPKK